MSDDFPDVKLKALFNFPANVVGGPNVIVSKSNGIYTISLDFTGAWTAYVPAVNSLSGALTSAAATGRYLKIGKTVFVNIAINIITNGTGAGGIIASLPFSPVAAGIMAGRANVSGKMLQAVFSIGGSAQIFNYDNSYPASNGELLMVEGVYEAA